MTREEFYSLAQAMKTYYPKENLLPTKESLELWYDMLQDLDYRIACASLKKFVATNKFAPTIADIREGAVQIMQPDQLNEAEAWSLVSAALRKSTYYAQEEYEKLPPMVQKAVGSALQLRNWAMDEKFNEEVARSNFMKTYRTLADREREDARLPQNVRAFIQTASEQVKQIEVESK